MNKVNLVGRLVRDNDTRYSKGEKATAVLRNAVAVNRRFRNAEGNYEADFPTIVAFGTQAEFIDKHFHKGDMIGIVGRLTTGSYTNKDGTKVYTTEVTVEEVEFVGGKNSSSEGTTSPRNNASQDTSFMNIPENSTDEGLPFD